MEELEADLANKEQRLLEDERQWSSLGSRVQVAAAWWFMAKTPLRKRKSKKSKRRMWRRTMGTVWPRACSGRRTVC